MKNFLRAVCVAFALMTTSCGSRPSPVPEVSSSIVDCQTPHNVLAEVELGQTCKFQLGEETFELELGDTVGVDEAPITYWVRINDQTTGLNIGLYELFGNWELLLEESSTGILRVRVRVHGTSNS